MGKARDRTDMKPDLFDESALATVALSDAWLEDLCRDCPALSVVNASVEVLATGEATVEALGETEGASVCVGDRGSVEDPS